MKKYKWLRGLLKASAFATVMFTMQACYGTPHPMDEAIPEEEMSYQADTIQDLDQANLEEVADEAQ